MYLNIEDKKPNVKVFFKIIASLQSMNTMKEVVTF